MKTFVVIATVLAAACAAPSVTIQKLGLAGPSKIVRAPAHDSASIESHRLGGNFAYATATAHAYASITPEISVATHPVAETTYTHQPAPVAHVTPAKIVNTHHAAKPVFGQQPILAQEPVIGEVARHTTVHQPIYKQQHVTVHQPQQTIVQQQYAALHETVHAPVTAPVHTPVIGTAVEKVGIAAAPAVAVDAVGYAGNLGYAAGNLGYAAAGNLGYAAAGHLGYGANLAYGAGIPAAAAALPAKALIH